VLCSSVPRVTGALRRMSERYFGHDAVVIEPGIRTGLPILYDNPKEVGADLVSVGALTHSAPVLDIGLDVVATGGGGDPAAGGFVAPAGAA
ncbi:MAG TPA: type III pantothenate kinase, partial [Acidimicrobiales bacterium]|nr:type III pantothenate kinase [Acidimicrobiales bacterium]